MNTANAANAAVSQWQWDNTMIAGRTPAADAADC